VSLQIIQKIDEGRIREANPVRNGRV